MGSPVRPIMANLYIVYFGQKPLSTATHPLGFGSAMWMTHCHQKDEDKQHFLEHINSVDLAIPFLDIIVKPEADNTLSITVYGMPIQMDQYLQ